MNDRGLFLARLFLGIPFILWVAIVLGYPVRTVGILLGLWCLATAKQAHMGNLTEILKNATMAGGFFLIAATGAGSLSLFRGTPPGPLARLR